MNTRFSTIGTILILFCMVSGTLFAQAVKIGGEIRTRTEMRDGFKSPVVDSTDAALVTNLRTRLNLAYNSNVFKVKITLQDTRTYGQTAPGTQVATTTTTTTSTTTAATTTDSGTTYKSTSTSTSTSATNATGIYEAWGEYLFAPGISLAMGRQALEYDDKRIFSASNWSNTGNAHDVLLLKYTTTNFIAHLGSAWNNGSDVQIETAYKTTYKTMNYLWLTRSIGSLGASALWVNEGFQSKTKASALRYLAFRNTLGGNLWFNNPDFPVNSYLTGYYQYGYDNSTSYKKLEGFLLAGKLQGKINKKIALNAGEDYYSGSSATTASSRSYTFNKLYGTNHSFNGSMEYWTTPPTQGLSDLYFGIETKPLEKLKADLTFHKFDLAKRPAVGNKDLGSELDLTVNYDVSPEFSVQGGYSTYFLTDAVKTAKKITTKVDTPTWAYVMLTFKPAFLNVK